MSTRSYIGIILKPEDRQKELVCPDNAGYKTSANGNAILYVYCHNDGYPEGVGKDLVKLFKDYTRENRYDAILKFILKGDRSTTYLSYIEWRNEPWKQVNPISTNDKDDLCDEDYAYLYDSEKDEWYIASWHKDWKNLSDVI